MIKIRFFPEGKEIKFSKGGQVKQILKKLNLSPTTALVIKNNQLLTSDLFIKDGDEIEIRLVGSKG
ncbi:MAG: hypothetical protein DRP81_03780 [Candidatus Omnitrophota bacterium]|nr:MoaD/ThiS family protein [Candidatus Desulfofervidus auxilii]RKY45451.1 MAG: hypothetical protein DRP81_03780 [Candidatus Omnitrophota bacterium]